MAYLDKFAESSNFFAAFLGSWGSLLECMLTGGKWLFMAEKIWTIPCSAISIGFHRHITMTYVFPRIGGGVRPAVYVRAKKDIMAGQEVGEIKDPIVLSIKYWKLNNWLKNLTLGDPELRTSVSHSAFLRETRSSGIILFFYPVFCVNASISILKIQQETSEGTRKHNKDINEQKKTNSSATHFYRTHVHMCQKWRYYGQKLVLSLG